MESSEGGDQSASTPSREESPSTVGRVKSGLVGGLSWLRSILFASKLHALVTIVLGVVLLVVLAFVLGFLGAPSVQGVENRFAGVNDTTTTIESDLTVHNPNPIGFQFGDTTLDYEVDMNGIRMAQGSRAGLSIERGNSTIPLTTYMDNERIPDWWASHVGNGEHTTVTVNADAHTGIGVSIGAPKIEREIETDITGGLNSTETRPVNANMALVSDPVIYINETSATWGEVSETETPIGMTFTVYNPKDYAIPISELGYDVTMNGVAVGEGASDRSVVIGPGETRTITATTVIRNDRLDEWWVTHLERNQVTNLTIDFYVRIDLTGIGGGSVRVPLDSTSQTIETDIFGNKDEAAPGADDSGDGSDDETGTDTDGTEPTGTTGGETDTPTDDPIDDPLETPTPSPTPEGATPAPTPTPDDTPTPTDGDGLL